MRTFLCLLSMAAVGALASGQATGNQFVGTWENVDSATGGLLRLTVTATLGGLQVHALGKCQPTDCDWGTTPLNLLGFNVDDRNPSWAMASWDLGVSMTHLVAHLEGREMLGETYTIFKDQSSRANYRSSYRLRQQGGVSQQAPPAQATDSSRVYRVGSGVSAPVVSYQEQPRYTGAAGKAGIDGSVTISLVVGADGVPRDLRIVRSLDPGLDQNALDTVRKWRFQPAQKDGQPVAVYSTIEVSFHLLKNQR
jgi:TonB family protein